MYTVGETKSLLLSIGCSLSAVFLTIYKGILVNLLTNSQLKLFSFSNCDNDLLPFISFLRVKTIEAILLQVREFLPQKQS